MKKHIITEEEYSLVKEASKQNKNKRIDKKLQVIIMRYEGYKDIEIGEKLGYARKSVSQLCAQFKSVGINIYGKQQYKGNHRALSEDEEREILKGFEKQAIEGELVTVQDIKVAFDKKRGKDTAKSYIYDLLKRYGWRKIMPRSKHPNKASEEVIETSKKLTQDFKK